MSAPDLELIWARARMTRLGCATGEVSRYCARHGLDIREIEAHAGACGVVRAVFSGSWFDLPCEDDPDAVQAVCIEALGDDDETCVDLVAWPIDRPEAFAVMCDRAAMLGKANVVNAATYAFGEPLRLHRTPLGWLKERCCGAVILNPLGAAWELLEADGLIGVEDAEHAREIAASFDRLDYRRRIVIPDRQEVSA